MERLKLSRRCQVIDSILGGGVPLGYVVEVCGESGIGKPQLFLQLMISAVIPSNLGGRNGHCIYITFANPFPNRRVHQLVSRIQGCDPSTALEKLVCMTGNTQEELRILLNDANNLLKRWAEEGTRSMLLVVDSLYGFIAHQFPDNQEGWELRANVIKSVGYALRMMAQKYHVSAIVTNLAVDVFAGHGPNTFVTSGKIVKPGIGYYWEKQVQTRLRMARESFDGGQSWVRTLQLRHNNEVVGACRFGIAEEGLVGA